MNHSLRALAGLMLVALLAVAAPATAAVPGSSTASCRDASTTPTAANVAAIRASVHCLVNAERAKAGIAPLTGNAKLQTAAQRHSTDMVARRFFSHTTPEGVTFSKRIVAAGYTAGATRYSLAENIAWGSGSRATPAEIVKGWMASPGHRANILNASLRDSGIGVAYGTPSTTAGQGATYTQDFGSRA